MSLPPAADRPVPELDLQARSPSPDPAPSQSASGSFLRLGAWFGSALGLIVVVAIAGYLSILRGAEQKAELLRTYQIIGLLEAVVSELKDVQSAQRGYVITGRREYLTPYDLAVPRIRDHLARLEALLEIHQDRVVRLDLLKTESQRRIEIADRIIATYRREGEAAAFALIREGSGKLEMDLIRNQVAEMVAEEQRLLDQRRRSEDEASVRLALLGLAGIGICLAVLATVFVLMHRENRLRVRTQRSLQRSIGAMEALSGENAAIERLGEYLRNCRQFDEAIALAARLIAGMLPRSSGMIAIFDADSGKVVPASHWGQAGEQLAAASFGVDACWALRRGQVHSASGSEAGPVCEHLSCQPAAFTLCLPMQAHGKTLGVVSIRVDDGEPPPEPGLARRVVEQVSLVSANLRLQEQLWQQTVRDPLTNLFNRRYLEPTLEREVARAWREQLPLSLMILDLDHFKRINDEHGHDGGDVLLRAIARLIRDGVRRDDIACRYGGEEFVIVLPNCPLALALERAEDLRQAVTQLTVTVHQRSLPAVTTSVGLASLSAEVSDAAALITAADRALYAAKNGGRNRIVVADSSLPTVLTLASPAGH